MVVVVGSILVLCQVVCHIDKTQPGDLLFDLVSTVYESGSGGVLQQSNGSGVIQLLFLKISYIHVSFITGC